MNADTTRSLSAAFYEVARIAILTQHKLSVLESILEEEHPALYLAYRETLAARAAPTISFPGQETRLTSAA